MRERFWERYSLGELNQKEWEALCDGCGKCCLKRVVKDNHMTVYSVACRLLDLNTTRCSDYANRLEKMPTCHALTPNNVPQYTWLPKTCAYRRVHLGKPLPEWHPLLTGNRNEMRKRGEKVGTFALSRNDVNKRQMERHVLKERQLKK